MANSKHTSSVGQCIKEIINQIDQIHLSREVEKQHEQFEDQVQEQVKAQVSLVLNVIEARMDSIEATLERLFKLQVSSDTPNANKEIGKGKAGEVPVVNVVNEDIDVNQSDGRNLCHGKQGHRGYIPELPFPTYNDTDLASWVWKCDTYFDLYQIAEDHKTPLAVLHFNDTAMTWYQGEKGNKEHLSWDELKEMLIEMSKDWGTINPMARWKQLDQTVGLEEYIKAKVTQLFEFPTISESFFVESFISDLKEEVQCMVQVFNSDTPKDVFQHAMHDYEGYIKANLDRQFHAKISQILDCNNSRMVQ